MSDDLADPTIRAIIASNTLHVTRSTWHVPGFWYVQNGDQRGLEDTLVHRFSDYLTQYFGLADVDRINVQIDALDVNNDELVGHIRSNAGSSTIHMACNMITRTPERLKGTLFGCATVGSATQLMLGPGFFEKTHHDPADSLTLTHAQIDLDNLTMCVAPGSTFATIYTNEYSHMASFPSTSMDSVSDLLANRTCDATLYDSPVLAHVIAHEIPVNHPNTGSWAAGPMWVPPGRSEVHRDSIACVFPEDSTGDSDTDLRETYNEDLKWHWNEAYKTFPWDEVVAKYPGTKHLDALPGYGNPASIPVARINHPKGTVKYIVDKQRIRIAVTKVPSYFEYDSNGYPTGFSTDLATHFVEYLQKHYGKVIDIEYVTAVLGESGETTTRTFSRALQDFTFDVVAGAVTGTMDTYRVASVGSPFMYGHLSVLYDNATITDGPIVSMTDLNQPGLTICVTNQTIADLYAVKYLPQTTITRYDSSEASLTALLVDKVCMFRLEDHEVLVAELADPVIKALFGARLDTAYVNDYTWLNSAFLVPMFRLDPTPTLPIAVFDPTGVSQDNLAAYGQVAIGVALTGVAFGWVLTIATVAGVSLLQTKAAKVVEMADRL